ncbi:MAG: cyclic pyranopterin monophosphate synthase MoaC [Polyangiaceae bacterium]|nr:cyclic pyranopterin monophosphate synthase MoaC [Polyangiaceae bacterium]
MTERVEDVVFSFEDVGDALSLLPLAARRALDVAGLRLSLEGYQSLVYKDRLDLAILGARDSVDTSQVERIVRRSSMPPARIKPVADPDARTPPEQLNAALGPKRALDPIGWSKLRALDRYALVHVMRRSIAHDDPNRLEVAASVVLAPPRAPVPSSRKLHPNPAPQAPALVEEQRVPSMRVDPRSSDLPARTSNEPFGARAPKRPAAAPPSDRPTPELNLVEPSIPMALMPPSFFEDRPTPLDLQQNRSSSLPSEPPRPPTVPPSSDVRSFGEGDNFVSSHLDEAGHVRMVSVGEKEITRRRATASGHVRMRVETAQRLLRNDTPKGDVLASARLAGIMAAKRTPELIPLCHHVAVTSVEVTLDIEVSTGTLSVTAVVEALDRTGVEMEAMTAVSVACLTIYDMLKGIDREMVIGDIRLLTKSGGRTGNYVRDKR